MDHAVMAHFPQLTGANWYEWQKDIETYFLLISCRGHVGSTRPGGDKEPEWDVVDQKAYAVM